MPLEPGARLGQYEILGQIGAGGMGEVYRARDTRLERDVAIKILAPALARDPDALARFEREALSVAKLSHPNVLAIYEFGRQQDTTFVVSELVDGITLRERLAPGPLPQRRAVGYAQQIARGIAAAHARGVVHRDLKPENVMIGRDDQVKILDFGLAKPVPTQPADETRAVGVQTHAGIVLGTFAYMAPEQIRGVAVDHRTDIFAFGATLYEMLSGERAFQGATAADTMTAILTKEPAELDAATLAVTPALDRIVRRCLEKSPELRFQSATDLAFALETLSSTATPVSAAIVAMPSAPAARRWTRALAVATLLGVVAAAGVAGGRLYPAAKAGRGLPEFTRLTFRRGHISGARFTTDGQNIVYSANWDSEPSRIYPLRTERPRAEAQPIVQASLVAVSRSGDMAVKANPQQLNVFIERGTLAQVPLAGGEPRPLLDQVDSGDTAPDGRLAVVRSVGGRVRLEFPAGTVLYETPGWISSPRFAPDGTRIAFHEHPLLDDDRGWVSVVNVSTRAMRHVTGEYDTLSGLAWAPGGREICFVSGTTINCTAEAGSAVRIVARAPSRMILHDIAADGRMLVDAYSLHGKLVVADAQGHGTDVSWQDVATPIALTRDGRKLLFGTVDYSILLRGLAGGEVVRLGSGVPVDLSPDERWVLAITPEVPTQLTVQPTGAGETRALPRGPLASHNWAQWLPDGRHIVITANEAGHGSRLYLQAIDGGDPAPISDEGVRLKAYLVNAVSPDGRTVIALGPDGAAALYSLTGGAPRPIAGLGEDLAPLGWSETPNVLFARTRAITRLVDIYRVDVVSGRRERWRTIGESDPTGAPVVYIVQVMPSGRLHMYSSNQTMSDLFLVSSIFD